MEEISCFFLEKIVYVCSGKVIIHERRRMGMTGRVHIRSSHPIPKDEEKNMKTDNGGDAHQGLTRRKRDAKPTELAKVSLACVPEAPKKERRYAR